MRGCGGVSYISPESISLRLVVKQFIIVSDLNDLVKLLPDIKAVQAIGAWPHWKLFLAFTS